MARGDIVTVAAGSGFGSKPRPAVIIQSDDFRGLDSVTVCLLTSQEMIPTIMRPTIEPTPENRLNAVSRLMIDKIMTIRNEKIGRRIGKLSADDLTQLDSAIATFLGLARG